MGTGATPVEFDELRERLAARAKIFNTSVVGQAGHGEAFYVGCGTLVTVARVPGVLTAGHVWRDIEDSYTHVAIAGTKSFSAPGIPVAACRVACLGPPEPDNQFGPDLAFFRLPEDYAIAIGESGRRFYDLATHRAPSMALPPTAVGEPRLVFAVPAESTSQYIDEESTGPVTRFNITTHAFTSSIGAVHQRDGYDYADFSLEEKRNPDDFPADYHGASGSAMWWVGHQFTDSRVLSNPDKILLDGVVLRHGPNDRGEVLRCHGRASVYRFYELVAESEVVR